MQGVPSHHKHDLNLNNCFFDHRRYDLVYGPASHHHVVDSHTARSYTNMHWTFWLGQGRHKHR